jgi:signal transduction histidine kinase
MNAWWDHLPMAAFVLEGDTNQQPGTEVEADLAAGLRIQAINPRAQTLLGSERCSIGQPARELVSCIAAEVRHTFMALWQHCLAQQTALNWEGPLAATGSDQRWVRLELAPPEDPNGQQRWHGVVIDLSAGHQREAALQSRLNASCRLLDRLLERVPLAIANLDGDDPEITLINVSPIRETEEPLRRSIEGKLRVSLAASAVAHEISQPLSSILLNSKLALRVLDGEHADAGALRSLLEPLASEAERINLITERISMLLRNVDTHRVPLDLREVVHSASLQLQPRLLMAGLELECLLPDHPCPLRGDAVQLQLAVVNVLRNALEAIQEASPATPRLQLRLQQLGDWLELRVADSGMGFPEGLDSNLPLTTTKPSGTGIGLYVVRLTLENHGGRLHLSRSAALGGAEVVLMLPLADQAGS